MGESAAAAAGEWWIWLWTYKRVRTARDLHHDEWYLMLSGRGGGGGCILRVDVWNKMNDKL